MKGYIQNIVEKARQNKYFREVLESGKHTQIVVMNLGVGEEIGAETHPDNDQILYMVEGEGKAILDGTEQTFSKGDIFLVRAGVHHNFINTGSTALKIITTYSPPHHPQGTIHKTKEEAAGAEY